ncbi:hypothetical protein HaLaN_27252, partial [Haematococcus lacustris]
MNPDRTLAEQYNADRRLDDGELAGTVLDSSTRGARLVFQKLKRRDQCTEPGSSHDSTPSTANEPT